MGTMQADFTGEVVFVTGAAGGMGRAISLGFAAAGATVVMADIDVTGGVETERLARDAGGAATFVATDVARPDQVAAAVAVAVEHGRLDVAVNAAAIENETTPLHECDLDAFDRMQSINVRGMFVCLQHELRAMVAAGRGSIVNIASTNSFRPQPNQPAYTASKHAVIGLTRSAALDYAAHGIRVNAICPGAIDTPMLRAAIARRGRDPHDVAQRLSLFGRFGTPEEIAAATMWLCSSAAAFTTGHALGVDAGYLTR
jgi:NAD(P)-dependent dehydrogenase (short-subunit alcohol dehydrogenase family)